MNKILLTDGQFWILKCRGGGGGVVRKVSFLEREFKALYPSKILSHGTLCLQ